MNKKEKIRKLETKKFRTIFDENICIEQEPIPPRMGGMLYRIAGFYNFKEQMCKELDIRLQNELGFGQEYYRLKKVMSELLEEY